LALSINAACTNTQEALGQTTVQWYYPNGYYYTSTTVSGANTIYIGYPASRMAGGFFVVNGSRYIYVPQIFSASVSSIAAYSSSQTITMDISVAPSSQAVWLTPIVTQFVYGTQYLTSYPVPTIEVEPNYVGYSLNLPSCVINQPVTFIANSIPTGAVLKQLLTITNPFYVVLGGTTIQKYPLPPPVTINYTQPSNVINIGLPNTQGVAIPAFGISFNPNIVPSFTSPIGFIFAAMVGAIVIYYARGSSRSTLLGLSAAGAVLTMLGFSLMSYYIVAIGLLIFIIAIAAWYMKRSTATT
jgi:hypothetical protein